MVQFKKALMYRHCEQPISLYGHESVKNNLVIASKAQQSHDVILRRLEIAALRSQ